MIFCACTCKINDPSRLVRYFTLHRGDKFCLTPDIFNLVPRAIRASQNSSRAISRLPNFAWMALGTRLQMFYVKHQTICQWESVATQWVNLDNTFVPLFISRSSATLTSLRNPSSSSSRRLTRSWSSRSITPRATKFTQSKLSYTTTMADSTIKYGMWSNFLIGGGGGGGGIGLAHQNLLKLKSQLY